MVATRLLPAVAAATAVLAAAGCGSRQPNVTLELFVVSPAGDQAIGYGRFSSALSRNGGDPDAVARRLAARACTPAILHSTSWRWETGRNAGVDRTWAYSEGSPCRTAEPLRLAWGELLRLNPRIPRSRGRPNPRAGRAGPRNQAPHLPGALFRRLVVSRRPCRPRASGSFSPCAASLPAGTRPPGSSRTAAGRNSDPLLTAGWRRERRRVIISGHGRPESHRHRNRRGPPAPIRPAHR